MLQQERRNNESQEAMEQNAGKFMQIMFLQSEIIFLVLGD